MRNPNADAPREFAAALQTVAERQEALETLAWIFSRHLARQRRAIQAAYTALGELQPQGKAEPGLAALQVAQVKPERAAKAAIPAETAGWVGDLLR
jgi:hypothetical protein